MIDMDRQMYLAKIDHLLMAFKELQECQDVKDNYSLLDNVEKISELFNVLSHDYTIGIKEIYNLLEFYILYTDVPKPELKQTLENVHLHLLSVTALCCQKKYIEQQQIFFERLFTELNHMNTENSNLSE